MTEKELDAEIFRQIYKIMDEFKKEDPEHPHDFDEINARVNDQIDLEIATSKAYNKWHKDHPAAQGQFKKYVE